MGEAEEKGKGGRERRRGGPDLLVYAAGSVIGDLQDYSYMQHTLCAPAPHTSMATCIDEHEHTQMLVVTPMVG